MWRNRFARLELKLDQILTAIRESRMATQADLQAVADQLTAENTAQTTAITNAITALQNLPGSPPPVTQTALDSIVAQLQTVLTGETAEVAALNAATAAATPPTPTA